MLPIADLAVKAAVVGLAFYPLVDPDSSHFQGKAMAIFWPRSGTARRAFRWQHA